MARLGLNLPRFDEAVVQPDKMRRLVEEVERLNRALQADFEQKVIHLSKNVIQNVGGANGTVVYISWDATAIHKDDGFTHEDVTNPTRIQVNRAGRYSVLWMVGATQGGAARTALMSHIRIDGTTSSLRGRQRNYSRGAAYGDISVGMHTEIDLTAGQYIECGTTVDDTDAAYTINTINAECEIIIRRLS